MADEQDQSQEQKAERVGRPHPGVLKGEEAAKAREQQEKELEEDKKAREAKEQREKEVRDLEKPKADKEPEASKEGEGDFENPDVDKE